MHEKAQETTYYFFVDCLVETEITPKEKLYGKIIKEKEEIHNEKI